MQGGAQSYLDNTVDVVAAQSYLDNTGDVVAAQSYLDNTSDIDSFDASFGLGQEGWE